MPKLEKSTEVAKFYLPSTKDEADEANKAWVDLEIGSLTAGDAVEMPTDSNEMKAAIALLAIRIKDWNFTEDDGSKTPITVENVGRLDIEDFSYLASNLQSSVKSLTDDQKKS